ncbi:MAG: FeoB-associated Cys-rich membrane protein [Clostridia bacterium]|nr:FeoB-associated Cys-rich membrane protein [Clostridia bacterium]MBR4013641.1 FeoB-associated Cys-rich membrane protein [Clostridia bacterium]
MLADIIVIAVIVLIIGGASAYIVKAKKSGKKCIGCPDSCSCGEHCKGCSNNKN